MRSIHLATTIIVLLLIISTLGAALQLSPETTVTNRIVENVGEFEGQLNDAISGENGELAISSNRGDNNDNYILLFDEVFNPVQEYQVGLSDDLIYLGDDQVISTEASDVVEINNQIAQYLFNLTFYNRSQNQGQEVYSMDNIEFEDPNTELAVIQYDHEHVIRWQGSLYLPFFVDPIGESIYEQWGVIEINLQNKNSTSWILENGNFGVSTISLAPTDQDLLIRVIDSYNSTIYNMTTYHFDPDTNQLLSGREERQPCSGLCIPTISDEGELILTDYNSRPVHPYIEIIGPGGTQRIDISTNSSLQRSSIFLVDESYLVITFQNNPNQDLYQWFYVLNIETRELIKLPANPDNFENWRFRVIDDLVDGALITAVIPDNGEPVQLYRYDLRLAQGLDAIRQLGWALPGISLLVATGLGWMVMRVLRNHGDKDQIDLYPEIEN